MFASLVTLAPPPAPRATQSKRSLPAGFGIGTQIRTICGARAVEQLMAGDLLLDANGQIVEVRAIRRTRVMAADLVQIDPSAMGLGMAPGNLTRPLVVAAGQQLATRDWRTQVIFGTPVLAAAQSLVDGVHVRKLAVGAEWIVQLEFDEPTRILANGLTALVVTKQ
jgi:hypothetical protein